MTGMELNDWSIYPLNLSFDEISDPMIVIADFFSADDIPSHLRELLEWRSCVLEDRYYTGHKGSPSAVLFTHLLHIKLIEAMHLLLQPDKSKLIMTTAVHDPEKLDLEKASWRYFPGNLSEEELLNPFLAVKDFFKVYSLQQYREHLYNWLEAALSAKAADEGFMPKDIVNVYENLQMLYDAAWLIHQRSAFNPYLKIAPSLQAIAKTTSPSTIPNLYRLNSAIPADGHELISRLVSKIKHKLPAVQAVIYLGVAPGKSNIVFLLVITPSDEQRQAQALSAMLEESCLPIAEIVALVHHESFLTNAETRSDLFVHKALNCPVIYLSGNMLLPSPKSINNADGLYRHQSKFNHWLAQGKDFLKGGEYYLQNQAVNAALFSLHQCAECLLVAIIRGVTGYRINVHNLNRLLKVTQLFTNGLAAVFDLNNTELKELFDLLQHAYINVRYKDDFEADRVLVDALFIVVSKLAVKVEQLYITHLSMNSL